MSVATRDRIKGITIEIDGDTTKLQDALKGVNTELKNTTSALKDVDRLLKVDPGNTDLLRQKQKLLNDAIGETENKLKKEKDALEQLRGGEQTEKTREQQERLTREIADTENQLKSLKDEYRNFGSVAGQQIAAVGEDMKDLGGKITDAGKSLKYISGGAAGLVGGAVKSAIGWESDFAGVMKTVDETATTTYDDIEAGLKKMATETASSKKELAGVAEVAGQLGVVADDILDFTETAVKLGDTTDLSAESAATSLAQFYNVMGTGQDKIKNAGSAIVYLGNNYATTESKILDMTTRLAGAAKQIGLTEGETLGIATALSSVGIEAEMGGSAFSKAMIKMQVASESGYEKVNDVIATMKEFDTDINPALARFYGNFRDFYLYWNGLQKDDKRALADSVKMTVGEVTKLINSRKELEGFAEVAGMTADQFVDAYRNRAVDAIVAFTTGLANTEERGESTIQMLQDMGFTEVRLRDTLTRAANASDLFTQAIDDGNRAFEENNALDEEAAKRYETTESKISQSKEAVTNLAAEIGENLLPMLQDCLEFVKKVTEKFSGLDEETQNTIITVGLFVAAASPLLIALGSIISSIGTILTLAPMLLSPIGLIVAAIVVLIGILAKCYIENEKFRDAVNKTWGDIWGTISKVVGDILTILQGILDYWAGVYTGDWDRAWGGLKKIVSGAVGGITDLIAGIIKTARDAIDALAALFGWQKKIEGGGGGGGSFYSGKQKFAAGYHQPYILTNPTIFGAANGKLLQGGDGNGSEVVVGTNLLRSMMADTMEAVLAGAGGAGGAAPVINLTVDVGGRFFDQRVIQATQNATYLSGGR